MNEFIGGSVGGYEGGAEGGARKRMYKVKHCSPGESDVSGSCLDSEDIENVAKAVGVDKGSSAEETHGKIAKKMEEETQCTSEKCWIKEVSNKLKKDEVEELKDNFKPDMPKKWEEDPNEWLTTEDIENALNQYAEAYDDVYFYGALPIDFRKCSVSDLCSFNLKKHMKRKEHKIGIVFNTDESDEDGEHWITMFIEIKPDSMQPMPMQRVRTKRKCRSQTSSKTKSGAKPEGEVEVYYFDSFGRKPPSEIKDLVEKIEKQAKKCKLQTHYRYNDICHQRGDSQCGVYAIHFLDNLLTGKMTFPDYLSSKPTDKDMIEYRKIAFVPQRETCSS